MKTITVKAEIRVPKVPNFFIQSDGSTLPIEAVTDEELEEIGKAYTQELIEQAQKKRAIKKALMGGALEGK